MATERYLTPIAGTSVEREVEVYQWFRHKGKRYAVVFFDHHGEDLFNVREECFLRPVNEHEEEAA
jgi:hypothetical protein